MKTDLATSVGVAIIGVVLAYFLCNFLIPKIESARIKTVDSNVSATLEDPDVEVFNYRSINPTVEVYVGQCKAFDENGTCIDGTIISENYDEVSNSEAEEFQNTNDQQPTNNQPTTNLPQPDNSQQPTNNEALESRGAP